MRLRKLVLSVWTIFLILGSVQPTSLSAVGDNKGIESLVVFDTPTEGNYDLGTVVEQDPMTKDMDVPGITEEETVTESVYFEKLAVEKTELVIQPGESVVFTNNTARSTSILTDAKSTNDIRYDYVNFNSEGRILSEDMGHTGSLTSHPNGGTTIITVDYDYPLTVTFNAELSYTYSPVPALLKKTLARGESYLVSNQGYSSRSIMSDATTSNGKRYDYAIYKSDGSLETSSLDTTAKPSFSVGDEIVLTGTSDEPVTVAVPYEGYTGLETDEPAYDSVLLYSGESYKFTNVGTKTDSVEHAGTTKDKFDYVVYNPDGTETTRGTSKTTFPLVAVGKYIVLTLVSENPVRVGAPYRSFMGGNRENEAITQVTLSPGTSYKFTNNGSLSNPVKNNARQVDGLYDYTVYKADGSYSSQGFDSISTPQLPAGGFAIISVHGTSDITFDYTDDFSAELSDEPSHFRVTLSQGESYEFKNITSSLRTLQTNATSNNRFDWVEYYPDGTQQSKRANTFTDPQVAGGNSIVVTAVSAPVTFGAHYRLFTWRDKPGEAISKQIVRLGESYTFSNTGSKQISLTSDTGTIDGKYDVAVYSNDSSVYSVHFEETGNVIIPAGGYAIVTGQSENPATIYYTDTINVTSAEHPALLRATVPPGSSYTYENISTEMERLYSNAVAETNEFSFIMRRPDGTIYSEDPKRYTSVQVTEGYSITVTPRVAPITFGAVYTSFKGTPGENPAVNEITLNQNESYLFTNQLTSLQTLITSASKDGLSMFDFAMYDPDGKPGKAEFDQVGNLSVPAGSHVVVTVVSDQPVTFVYGQAFTATPSTEPALLKRVLEPGQLIGFKNKSNFEAKLITNANHIADRYFDYTILDANATVLRQGEQTTVSHDIPVGGSTQVKTTSANPVIFAGPYKIFEFVEAEEYVFEELKHRQSLYAKKNAGENGYYRFVAPEAGHYRFVTLEMNNFTQQPILTLYNRSDLLDPIGSSEKASQEFGVDYTVLETDLESGQTVYLKLSEKNGLPLEVQLTVAIMTLAPETKLQYTPDGRLLQMTFPTGDALIYEYDRNGNLKRRVKKVYPF